MIFTVKILPVEESSFSYILAKSNDILSSEYTRIQRVRHTGPSIALHVELFFPRDIDETEEEQG